MQSDKVLMMSRFGIGTTKNPPWARQAPAEFITVTAATSLSSLSQPQATTALLHQPSAGVPKATVYSITTPTSAPIAQPQYAPQQLPPVGMQGQPPTLQPGQVLSQPAIAIPTSLATTTQVASVSYPPPVGSTRLAPAQQSLKQRFFTGTVTKIMDNFGFVDDDVFFQMNCCKGPLPKVADRVLVEATYNPNMPFKWNATRIQVLPNQNVAPAPMGQIANSQTLVISNPTTLVGSSPLGVTATVVTPTIAQTPVMAPSIAPPVSPNITPSIPTPVAAPPPVQPPTINQQPPPLMGQIRPPVATVAPPPSLIQQSGTIRVPMSARRGPMGMRFDRDREREQRDKDREMRERERREQRRDKSLNKRPRSPNNHRSHSPSQRARSPKRRRNPRVVPRYVVQIPKLSLETKEANVMVLKSRYSNLYIPSDFFQANFTWTSAFPLYRPFQLGTDCTFHVMPKDTEPVSLNGTECSVPALEPSDADHLYSAKVMLLSSPKLEDIFSKCCGSADDSPDNSRNEQINYQHPTRLIQFLVGLKGKNEPMSIGGPWSPSLDGPNPAEDPKVLIKTAIRCTRALTNIDLSMCTQWYRFAEIRYIRPEEMHKGRLVPARVETVVLFLPDVWSIRPTCLEWESLRAAYKSHLQKKLAGSSSSSVNSSGGTATDSKDDTTTQEEEEAMNTEKEPTHFSELDPKTMKIVDLRRELEDRNLSSKGLKSQLIARLTKILKSEKEEEEELENNKAAAEEAVKKQEEFHKLEIEDKDDKKKKEEEEKRRREEKEQAMMERKYNLPDKPSIIVHPSTTAKGGKFDCTVMSLSVLLDYRQEDNKEHSFEVSLFAELFNEMLMRDFGFKIYKALVLAPEKKDEEKLKKKSDDKSVKEKDLKKTEEEKSEKKKEEETPKEVNGNEEDMEEDEPDDEDDDEDKKDKVGKRDRDEKKKEKKKYYTFDPALLLAFVYFDQNHTGYLLDKDIEEIMHTVGMQLSRAQVRKYVQKLVSRDTLNYRKLTDKPKAEDATEDGKIDSKGADSDDIKLAQGNYHFLNAIKAKNSSEDLAVTSKLKGEGEETAPNSGFISYNGALIDIDSITQRLEKSEKNRSALEEKLQDSTAEIDLLKDKALKREDLIKQMQQELTIIKKEKEEQIETVSSTESENRRLFTALKHCEKTLTGLLKGVTTSLTPLIIDKKKKFDKKVKNENDTGE
ncbi:cell division cycle and apoptosis regulator protein 1 isoform X1 [Octopus sinensis]|uniref:Cell division cycle and apoptosis regulator protein 1 isoform X1 n=2 Tax=Octopus sinensis TaxID=2607531 RepID=A0A6P7SD72_9MOLL|nr:cell division cycle and apoptosis regulator protein 1 isoform X1 [Octopus sinensis]